MIQCNTTLDDLQITEDPLWENGLTFHHLGLILSALFGLISLVIAFILIFQHATHYLKPFEQKHIIRILFMIPVYSTVSFLSYLYYKHSIYFEVLRDCYEAFAIASFFTLLCHYVAPDLHEQKNYFRGVEPVNWFWGVFGLQKCTGGQNKGPFRKPRSGLTWFNVVWIGVYQYCFVRVLFTIVSVVSQVFDRYCEHSLNPAFAHIWVVCFEGASVTIAMFCLIQFYIQLKTDLAEHKPFMKVLCIKLVIFFSFWQTLVISFLASSSGPLQPTKKINYPDIYTGIPNTLLCIEMAFFAILHIFAFSPKPYNLSTTPYDNPLEAPGTGYSGPPPTYRGGPLGLYALIDSFNPWDIVKASARGFRWLFVGYKHRHQDSSYAIPAATKVASLDTGYYSTGPLYGGPGGGGATELGHPPPPPPPLPLSHLRDAQDPRAYDSRARADTLATDVAEDDRAGLLRHSGVLAGAGGRPSEDEEDDAAAAGRRNDEFEPGDDGARLDLAAGSRGAGLSRRLDYGDVEVPYGGGERVHPAFRAEEAQGPVWDHWAGAGGGGGRESEDEPWRGGGGGGHGRAL